MGAALAAPCIRADSQIEHMGALARGATVQECTVAALLDPGVGYCIEIAVSPGLPDLDSVWTVMPSMRARGYRRPHMCERVKGRSSENGHMHAMADAASAGQRT